ncbi:GCN5-related N-acetyltransferase [Desulfarculus baarsii DSM 2075]|uniref:GCN5-related N-acetyltransferase n=1 Tax=Desulfarculus baarsii (strain ATCC 33931 / DSM 2075 / LMG 7858 / VKM B-1802 / 2st14) TaxID=644282 RepID=E1QG74_DESB2|nr:GNAT family N-acetyltransferase [Desulfarculus baarsii]ADK83586.1 GCN5-related N-acetyltransferase [Desulfarculus baarsii DSM 2075]
MAFAAPWREELARGDEELVRGLCLAAGNFSAEEVLVAVELVQERRAKGLASGYHFVFAAENDQCPGYACFGPIACTDACWDLYWIVVDPARQGRGLGRALMAQVERRVAELGGRRVYVETSSRQPYAATRRFYAGLGYRLAARMDDFYAPGDAKMVYCRDIARA